MGIEIQGQNQSAKVIPDKLGFIKTGEFLAENAYKRGGKFIINISDSYSGQATQATIVGTVTTGGTVTTTVTSKKLPAPTHQVVSVVTATIADTASVIAGLIRADLALKAEITDNFTVSGATDKVILTENVIGLPDSTLNIGYASTDGTVGLVDDASSDDVTPAATINVTPKIEGLDPYTGIVYPLLTGVAMVAVGTQILTVHPDATAAANVAAAENIPRHFKLTMTHVGGDLIAYTATLNTNG